MDKKKRIRLPKVRKVKHDFTWDDLDKLVHEIKAERTVVVGAIHLLKKSDKKLSDIEDRLRTIILHYNDED